MSRRIRVLIVLLLAAAFAAGVPAGTLEAALATPCPAAAQADDCCGGNGADPGCAAYCAVGSAPVMAVAAVSPHAPAGASPGLAFSPPDRGSLTRAPDTAPPRSLLV